MEVLSLVTRFTQSSWNPLRNNSTNLPPNVVIIAKGFSLFLIIKTLFFSGNFFRLREPYLPFLSVFDQIGHPVIIYHVLQIGLYGSAVAILFNRNVRIFSLVAGSSIFLSILSAKGNYSNNFLFTSFILLLIGLQKHDERKSSWIRYQLAVLYLGAALNKWMDPDWQSGLFMNFWMNDLPIATFQYFSSFFPPMVFAKIISWFAIGGELLLGALALTNRLTSLFIFLGVGFHFALAVVTGRTFGWFFPMLVVSYASLIRWPINPIQVLYDGDCGFCQKTKMFMKKLDFDNFFNWTPFQFVNDHHGLTTEQLKDKLHLIVDNQIFSGFRAFRAMIIYNPLSYLFFIVLLAALSPAGAFTFPTKILLGLLLALVSKPFIPVGEAAYSFIAKRRYKLMGATEACEVSQQNSSPNKSTSRTP
ncbi:MAG TPA: DUF393 domain-containing protein [Flavitalea sp.]|nr:DUF393 domain-containing protein [Flavitalea sp.]